MTTTTLLTGGSQTGPTWFHQQEQLLIDNCIGITIAEQIPQNYMQGYEWDVSSNKDGTIVCYPIQQDAEWYELVMAPATDYQIALPENCLALFAIFKNVKHITGLNLVNWNNVTNLQNFIYGNTSLLTIDLSTSEELEIKQTVTAIGNFATNCSSLKTITLPKCSIELTRATHGIFSGCSSLTLLDLSPWHITMNVPAEIQMAGLFANCYSLQQILGLNNWTWNSPISGLSSAFTGCYSLKELNLSDWLVNTEGTMEDIFGLSYMTDENRWTSEIQKTSNNSTLKSLQKLSLSASFFTAHRPTEIYELKGVHYARAPVFPQGKWYDSDGNVYELQKLYEQAWKDENGDWLAEGEEPDLTGIPHTITLYSDLDLLTEDMPITMAEMTALADAIREKCGVNSWMTIDELIAIYEEKCAGLVGTEEDEE